jgi:hypothetical protein
VDSDQNSSEVDGLAEADQRKVSRPTVKLKGTPLLNLKRAMSNQMLEIDTGSNEMESSPSQDVYVSSHHQIPSNLPSLVNSSPPQINPSFSPLTSHPAPTSTAAAPTTNTISRNYLQLAHTYQHYLPYMNRYFDHQNTRCLICRVHTPIDLLFPCAHRCVCRNCLSLPPFDQFALSVTSTQHTSLQINYDLSLPSHQPTQEIKPKRASCPLCKSIIKLIIPVNGLDTEEKEYWDWVLESKNSLPVGGGGGADGLDHQFLQEFSENIPKILKSVVTEAPQQQEGGTRSEKPSEENEQRSDEIDDSFPQFAVEEQRASFCCLVQ